MRKLDVASTSRFWCWGEQQLAKQWNRFFFVLICKADFNNAWSRVTPRGVFIVFLLPTVTQILLSFHDLAPKCTRLFLNTSSISGKITFSFVHTCCQAFICLTASSNNNLLFAWPSFYNRALLSCAVAVNRLFVTFHSSIDLTGDARCILTSTAIRQTVSLLSQAAGSETTSSLSEAEGAAALTELSAALGWRGTGKDR